MERDDDEFLAKLLTEMPDGSYWKISGLYGTPEELLKPYFEPGNECGKGWTCIRLTKEIKDTIIELLSKANIAFAITHMEFWVDGKAWLMSYDSMMHNFYYEDFVSDEFKQYCRRWGWSVYDRSGTF